MKEVQKTKLSISRISLAQVMKYKRSLFKHERNLKQLRKEIEQYCLKTQVFKNFKTLKIC